MSITIKEVTEENVNEILNLQVDESQNSFIESTKQCLDDAAEHNEFKPVGLYRDECLVGFAMYGFFPDEGENGRVWLDRYLIDLSYQGQGLGKIALSALLDHIIAKYECKKIYLSLYDDNLVALNLYRKFGFEFNGEYDINKEKVMVKVVNE